MRGFMALWLCLLSGVALAKQRVAVLELHDEGGLKPAEARILGDAARRGGLALPRDRYLIMTRESMEALLPQGADLGGICGDGACEVAIGRQLGADLVLSGVATRLGGKLRIDVKLHATADGALLGMDTARGADFDALEAAVLAASEGLFLRGVGLAPVAAPAAAPAAAPVAAPQTAPPAAAPAPASGPLRGGIDWVALPAGEVSGGGESFPVAAFHLARSEVTVAQYRACVEANVCPALKLAEGCHWGAPGRDSHPINCLNWREARAFAAWAGGRLPNRFEWAYAARSGGKDQDYPWGDAEASCARAVMDEDGPGCGHGGAAPVCSKPKGHSAHGICDLAGNVWEWIEDEHCDEGIVAGLITAVTQEIGRSGATASCGSGLRLIRGGSYGNRGAELSARRPNWLAAQERSPRVGLRVAR